MNVSRRSVLTWGGLTALALGGGVGSSLYWNSSDAAKLRNIVAGDLDISKGEKTIYLSEGVMGDPSFETRHFDGTISWNKYRKFNGDIPEVADPFFQRAIIWMTDFTVNNYGDNMTANLIPKFEVSDWMKSVGFGEHRMSYYLLNKLERKDSFEFGFGLEMRDPNANDEENNYPEDYIDVLLDLSKGNDYDSYDPFEDSMNFASSVFGENKFEINPYFKRNDDETVVNDDGSIEFKKGETEFTIVARLNADRFYSDNDDPYADFYEEYRSDKTITKPEVFNLGSIELDYKQVEKP